MNSNLLFSNILKSECYCHQIFTLDESLPFTIKCWLCGKICPAYPGRDVLAGFCYYGKLHEIFMFELYEKNRAGETGS